MSNVPRTMGGTGSLCYNITAGEEPVHYPAYQVSQFSDLCLSLGLNAKQENVHWSLIGPFLIK